MRRFHAMVVAGVIGTLMAGPTVLAGLIDFRLTAGGSKGPFSDRVDEMPVPWAVLNQPLDAGTHNQTPWRFSEQGLGNDVLIDYGHIQYFGDNVKGRARRAIFDILAWVPVPQLLYLDPDRGPLDPLAVLPGPTPRRDDISGPVGFVESGGRSLILPPVPEPATIFLVGLSLAALTFGRRLPTTSPR